MANLQSLKPSLSDLNHNAQMQVHARIRISRKDYSKPIAQTKKAVTKRAKNRKKKVNFKDPAVKEALLKLIAEKLEKGEL